MQIGLIRLKTRIGREIKFFEVVADRVDRVGRVGEVLRAGLAFTSVADLARDVEAALHTTVSGLVFHLPQGE